MHIIASENSHLFIQNYFAQKIQKSEVEARMESFLFMDH